MTRDLEKEILNRAVEQGLLRIDTLVEKGILNKVHLAEFRAELVKNTSNIDADSGETDKNHHNQSNHTNIRKDLFTDNTFGYYQNLEFLGQGGMAQVYKAHDFRLKRTVALKLLRSIDPELGERLLSEARAQAHVEDPNVCKVYEAGEINGTKYIAMQYIAGKTLNRLIEELSPEEKVKLLKQVAETVHEAHRVGLIHRDLKPTNIMVEKTTDGRWVPYVMDFGLAREVEAAGVTQTGTVVGSPHYMSPEQAKGYVRAVDRRSDVYGLGVTAYEILTGRLPFPGESSTEVLIKVIHGDPPLLRQVQPSIPADLEAIVMKCLEKEPGKRYESARSLAEDLGRYLDGDPVTARRASFSYRFYRWARRHKATVTTVFLATLAIIIFALLGLRANVLARRQAILAQKFGQQIEKIDRVMRIAHMLPLHDIRSEKAVVSKLIKDIENQMSQVGPIAIGPGHYALGRGYLALNEYEKARDRLLRAWQSAYREPQVAYSLGLALGNLYQKGSEEAEKISDAAFKQQRLDEIEKKYREPVLQFLEIGRATETEAPEYVEALLAFYAKNWNHAGEYAIAAVRKVPWLYEAKHLEGEIYYSIGFEKQLHGKYQEAIGNLAKAEAKYQEAAKIAESDEKIHESQCRLLGLMVHIQLMTGKDPQEAYVAGEAACQKAVIVNPDSADAYDKAALLQVRWGRYKSEQGKDPTASWQQAIQNGLKAQSLKPDWYSPYIQTANAYIFSGRYASEHNMDPTKYFQNAIELSKTAIRIHRNNSDAYNNLGRAYLNLAVYNARGGADLTESIHQAVKSFEKAMEINPKSYVYPGNMGVAYAVLGKYQIQNGGPAKETFGLSLQSCQKALRNNPGLGDLYVNVGEIYLQLGEYEMKKGGDPTESLTKAVENCRLGKKITKTDSLADNVLGLSYQMFGEYELFKGKDPGRYFHQALEHFQTAVKIQPDYADAYVNLAETYRFITIQSKQPSSILHLLGKAKSYNAKAIQITPTHPDYYRQKAYVYLEEAKWQIVNRKSPEAAFLAAQDSVEKSIQLNPNNPESYLAAAELHRWKAEWHPHSRAAQDVDQGLEMIEKAIQINPQMAKALAIQGVLYVQKFRLENKQEAREMAAKRALEALKNALSLNRHLALEYQTYLQEAEAVLE